MEKSSNNISRRNFIAAAGGVTLAITAYALYPKLSGNKREIDPSDLSEEKVNAWVHLRNDGQITIYNPASEMGQGSMTALPVILAEELDADWDKVKIETAPINVDTYGFKAFGNRKVMINVGSRTVMGYYDALRQAGAQARYILLHSVAQHWSIPIQELSTAPNLVRHQASGKEISYGEIVEILQVPESIPEIPTSDLKDPANFRLIGKEVARYDVPSKVDGSAQFAMDIQVPDMHYGVLERGNVHGAKPTLTNAAEIQGLEGIVAIVPFDYAVGVVATTLEKALAAKAKLAIDWDRNVTAQGHDSQKDLERYQQMATASDGKILHSVGDVKAAMRRGTKKYQAVYKNDYIYHAQMEPLNAIAAVSPDGQSAEIWAGTQNPGSIAPVVAKELGIEAEQVKLNLCYLGGGLGRRSTSDYIIESVKLSQSTGKPVKLIWTREDDLQYGMYRPLSLQQLEAATDGDGQIIALNHCIVGDGSNLLASGARNEFYNIPNQSIDLRLAKNGIRIKHWRAVGHGPNKFAIESFIDEIAADQGKDPLDIRRALMKDSPRALATLEKAAEMANWSTPPAPGRARGIAFGERSGALCTGICEISLEQESGKIKVHHFWSAVDAGTIVQPDNVVAQMEGGIIMGMSSVFCEQLTIENGEIQQSNFHDYPILRIEDAPESIEIAMIPSTDAPKGIGEASTPIVAGAIANAFAALTGKRLRHLPFSPARVRTALEA